MSNMQINTIINGNSLDEMKKIPDNSIDLIFADPPYWMRVEGTLLRVEGTDFAGCADEWDQFNSLEDYETFTHAWLNECYRLLKPAGSIWVIGSMQCIYTIGAIMQRIGYWLINDVIWHKKNPTPNFMGTRLNNSHETLIWAAKKKNSKFTFNYKTAKELNSDALPESEYLKGIRKQMGSVWKFAVCSGGERLKDRNGDKLHSTQKPIELLERVITISSNIDDIVLDPFAGTMTTAAAAKRLGRNYLMIEKDKKYCDYGRERLETISFNDTPISRAMYDIKPVKVSLQEMITANALLAKEWFSLKDGKAIAQLVENGKLLYNGKEIDIHSCAALAKGAKAKRLNGFDHWYVKRGGKLVSINEIRENYRNNIAPVAHNPKI